ncbi:hypothetical protein K1719_011101 [Acacia pycnantha]|nr:hypothetical protein K1719_011101 [Acacia pycnantha]
MSFLLRLRSHIPNGFYRQSLGLTAIGHNLSNLNVHPRYFGQPQRCLLQPKRRRSKRRQYLNLNWNLTKQLQNQSHQRSQGFTDLGLKEEKDLVEKTPSIVKKGVSKEEGEQIIEKMKALGVKLIME